MLPEIQTVCTEQLIKEICDSVPLAWISGSRRYKKDCLNGNTIFSAYMLGKNLQKLLQSFLVIHCQLTNIVESFTCHNPVL